MGRKRKSTKRIMSDEGWLYYCSQCEGYKPESEFNKDRNRPFNVYYICKDHRRENYREKNGEPDKDLEHLKLVFVSQSDYDEKDRFLEALGYDLSKDIHQQFLERIRKKYGVKSL